MLSVSQLRSYMFCPRQLYLKYVVKAPEFYKPELKQGLVGHYVRQELALRYGKVLEKIKKPISEKEILQLLREELDKILEELPSIYREKLKGEKQDTEKLKKELENELLALAKRTKQVIKETGYLGKKLKEYLTPWKTEMNVKSEKLGIRGRIDAVYREDDRIFPVEIKTGRPPTYVWDSDKLQLAAYAMMLEERFDTNIPHGFVEYTQVNEKRPIVIDAKLRRQVFDVRDKVLDIIEGRACPQPKDTKKCESCGFYEVCYGSVV